MAATAYPSMLVQRNGSDIRIECNLCHASWSRSTCRADAAGHFCPKAPYTAEDLDAEGLIDGMDPIDWSLAMTLG